ncbi:MAG: Glycosyl transferase group 1 [Candidatus Peregrinibacteria bacterium GW2011_GWA2_43_8]|nr:MAG: Glycosyl transferase group 1 [Candidatus Peregrinibacteria bacterium GW2011_GWA2_43_8]
MPSEKANGIQVAYNCESFLNSGAGVELLLPRRFGCKGSDDISAFYNIDKTLPVKRIWCLDLFFSKMISGGRILSEIAFAIQSLSFYKFVAFHLMFKRTDVIYTRDPFLGLFLFFKRRKFLELHNFPQSWIGKSVYWFLLKTFSGVIVISEGLKKNVPGNVILARDGVKKELFDIETNKAQASDLPVFLYSGSLYEWKGVDLLLKAFKSVSDKALLYIVGGSFDEKDSERLKNIVSDLDIKNVVFVGHVEYKKTPLYLKTADFLVLPNMPGSKISELYTSPLKLFEYMLAKRLIIAADLPSLTEILNEKNSLLFKAGDLKSLEEILRKALDLKNKEKLIDNAYKDGLNFTWDARSKKILKFINERI